MWYFDLASMIQRLFKLFFFNSIVTTYIINSQTIIIKLHIRCYNRKKEKSIRPGVGSLKLNQGCWSTYSTFNGRHMKNIDGAYV
jgi:hypothetical protein